MYLIVGLGNPGPKYAGNRHNIGFLVVDHLADTLKVSFREKFKGLAGKGTFRGEDVVLLKPQTFVQHCGGPDFVRIRYGVGRPTGGQATASYVLSDFNTDEMAVLGDRIQDAIKRVEAVIRLGISDAMNRYNRK